MNKAEKVKRLREMTGAGMMNCKKTLELAGYDMDKAVEYLRRLPNAPKCGKIRYEGDCDDCFYETCQNTYNSESDKCKKCNIKRCLEDENGLKKSS